jgi:FHS family Na+ dependent glucose MFS transporter 1
LVFSEWMGQNYGVGYWLLALYALLLPFLLWRQPSPRFQARES